MEIARTAFEALFSRECPYNVQVSYNGKFGGYNANLRLRDNTLFFNLSKKWAAVGDDIRIGLIQELLVKMFKKKYGWKKSNTINMELYLIFLKKIHLVIPKTKNDSILEQSFERVNNKYFYSTMEKPNLVWAQFSRRKLGSYDFGTDTVKISRILHPENASEFLLDYVMYHELLHKKNKFISKYGRTRTHTLEFKMQELQFDKSQLAEKQISTLCRRGRGFFGHFFE